MNPANQNQSQMYQYNDTQQESKSITIQGFITRIKITRNCATEGISASKTGLTRFGVLTCSNVTCAERVVASVCSVCTLLSNSPVYLIFLSFDLAADCLFARILYSTEEGKIKQAFQLIRNISYAHKNVGSNLSSVTLIWPTRSI